jgi:copper transport protein
MIPPRLRFALALASTFLLAAPSSAWAHVQLVRSEPARGAKLTSPPKWLRLVFSEAPRLQFVFLELVGPDGRVVTLGPPRHPPDSARIVVADVQQSLGPGDYQLRWKAAAADGHPTQGTVTFTVLAGTMDSVRAPPRADSLALRDSATSPVASVDETGFSVNSASYILVRWFGYAAFVALAGILFFRMIVLTRLRSDPAFHPFATELAAWLRPFARIAAVSVLCGILAHFAAQAAVMQRTMPRGAGSAAALLLEDPWWRWAMLAQMAGAAAALAATSAQVWRAGDSLLGAGVVLAAFGPPLTGHAAASPNAALAIGADVIHVLAGGAWLGGVLCVALFAIPRAKRLPPPERPRAALALVRAFTPLALSAAGVLALTGLYSGWIHVGSFRALIQRDYGRMLLLKLALVAAMAILGALNWRYFGPRCGEESELLTIRRSTRLELALGILVLLVTSILTALPTPVGGP